MAAASYSNWLSVTDVNGRQGLVTVHLEGSLPARAERIRWRAPFMLSAYPLAVVGGLASESPEL